jgi:hypothetical protein
MKYYRQHSKVRLWWGKWWAVQHVHYWPPETSHGYRLEWGRPLLVLFLPLGITLCLGRHPVINDERNKHRWTSRGFLFLSIPSDEAVL